ncbi:MAG: glycosyltransferase N-terminal domain-containing protein [Muribaculaceae bacterium]|nr:glycosyltransferase N-terminal domain-containing protein [Muribaculaceae bacterium]
MNLIYNTAIRFYRLAVKIVAHKNDKADKMIAGQKRTLQIIKDKISPTSQPIWIHASSLGEFEQGRPLIEMIKREYPNQKILLSFFSPSGYEVRKDYPIVDAVCYLPFDTPANARQFINAVNPSMAIFIKYEFWGNYLQTLKEKNIPTFIISAIFRHTQSFFKPYGAMFRNMLKCYTTIFVQDEESKTLLNSIGQDKVEIMGDTRFDRVTDILAASHDFPAIEEFSENHFTLIMGSSWQPDEDIVFEYFNAHPEMRIIIAPHEINEQRIDGIIAKLNQPAMRYSQLKEGEKINTNVLIIDGFGILASCYRYADVAYIGGGFGVGIHNINEAAVYSIPVIFGPNHKKFKEARDLISIEGAFEINSNREFSSIMNKFITNPDYLEKSGKAAGEYISKNLGATKRIFDKIKHQFRQI